MSSSSWSTIYGTIKNSSEIKLKSASIWERFFYTCISKLIKKIRFPVFIIIRNGNQSRANDAAG